MAQPVWVLSVDLQTKTATFQTGLADAAKAARGSFNDIKGGAGEMGGRVSYSMMEARHSVMMLGEEFGIRLPRALSSFIAGLGPIGPALEAAFPFMAIAVGATVLIEHLTKMREAGHALTEAESSFGVAALNAFSTLSDKVAAAQMRVDELRKDHIGALSLELGLIDHATLQDLIVELNKLGESADKVFKQMHVGYLELIGSGGTGIKGVTAAAAEYQEKLAELAAKHDAAGMEALTRGTLEAAERIRAAQDAIGANRIEGGKHTGTNLADDQAKYNAYVAAGNVLKAAGIGYTKEDIAAQEIFTNNLRAQLSLYDERSKLQSANSEAARLKTGAEIQRDQQEAMQKTIELLEQTAAAQRSTAEQREQAARDALKQYESEQLDQIARTQEGTQARLNVLRDFVEQDEALQNTDAAFYRSILEQRNHLAAELDKEALRQREQSLKEQTAALNEAAKESIRHQDTMSSPQTHSQPEIDESARKEQARYSATREALQKEVALYRQAGLEKVQDAKRINDQIAANEREHQDRMAELAKESADANKRAAFDVAEHYTEAFARVGTGQEKLSRVFESMAESAVTNSIKAAFAMMAHEKETQLAHAKSAASGAMSAVSNIPIVGPILAPIAGAGVFAGAMAFAQGTDAVPGVGRGDIVPTMLTPGEGVVPGGVMDGLRNMARNGGFDGGRSNITVHVRPTYHVNTIDGDGMQDALERHSDQLQRHFENTLRKMNR